LNVSVKINAKIFKKLIAVNFWNYHKYNYLTIRLICISHLKPFHMLLDLKQSNVSLDPKFGPMLSNLQANILKGHGRNFAFHLFFSFDRTKVVEIKSWIAAFSEKIKSAEEQIQDNSNYKKSGIDGGVLNTLSLSAHGFDVLGLKKPTASNSFLNGMRADQDALGDDPTKYTAGINDEASPVDMMILVADDNLDVAQRSADLITTDVTKFSILLLSQKGKVLKKKDAIGGGIEHFGYADGISQPLYFADEIKERSTIEWDDKTDLERVLVKDGPEEADSYGSYLVFRKLEQNVKGFKDAEGDNDGAPFVVTEVIDENGKSSASLGGAMLVGRHEDGTPLVKSSLENLKPQVVNDFDYRHDEANVSKCPFHSHIRIMNPRNGDDPNKDFTKQRITRRGIPYEDFDRFGKDVIEITDDMLETKQPECGVGLLFMCYQSNIDTQFLILQKIWANAGNIQGHILGAEDSIIGQQANVTPKRLPKKWGEEPLSDKEFVFPQFVTNRGGEYLFTPSKLFLQNING